MPDDIDNMQPRLEFEEKIHRYQSKKDEPASKQGTGFCWNCGEPLQIGRWCDADCRDHWEKEEGYL